VIDCAFDESGDKTSPRGNLLVVSAYVGATAHVARLSRCWQSKLDEVGIPYFHTKDLWNRRAKLFRGLSNTQRKRLLSALISYIHRNAEWGFSAFIDPDYYSDSTTDRFRSQWGSPYAFAMRMTILCLILLLERLKRQGELVNILIEQGHPNAQQAMDMIAEFKAFDDRPLNIGDCELRPKKGNPTLQAADILAYASCDNFCGPSRIMEKLISGPRIKHFWINCNSEIVDLMQDTVRSYFARRKTEWLEKSTGKASTTSNL